MKKNKESTLMLKLVSLLLALLIWFRISGTVMQQERIQTQTFTNILLEFRKTPESIAPKSDNIYFVVSVSGTEKDLEELERVGFNVDLSLDSLDAGDYTLPITSENIKLPKELSSLSFERIIPNTVDVNLVKMIRKEVDLEVYHDGEPAENFSLKEIRLNPSRVTIEGPAREVADLRFLFGKNINIEGLNANQSGLVTLESDQVPEATVVYGLTNLRYTAVIEENRETLTPEDAYPLAVDPEWEPVSATEASLEIEGPISAVRWVDPAWIAAAASLPPTAEQNEDSPPLQAGDDPEEPPPPGPETLTVPITARFMVPQEVREAEPDWLAKMNRLTLKWTPAVVEIRNVKEGDEK